MLTVETMAVEQSVGYLPSIEHIFATVNCNHTLKSCFITQIRQPADAGLLPGARLQCAEVENVKNSKVSLVYYCCRQATNFKNARDHAHLSALYFFKFSIKFFKYSISSLPNVAMEAATLSINVLG